MSRSYESGYLAGLKATKKSKTLAGRGGRSGHESHGHAEWRRGFDDGRRDRDKLRRADAATN